MTEASHSTLPLKVRFDPRPALHEGSSCLRVGAEGWDGLAWHGKWGTEWR